MPIIKALFRVDVSSPCLIEWPEGSSPELTIEMDGMQVEVGLFSEEYPISTSTINAHPITYLGYILITVSHNEISSPPEVILTSDGEEDMSARFSYFRTLLPAYRDVAFTTANRILNYFRYVLFTPLVRPISRYTYSLKGPIWIDENMSDISKAILPLAAINSDIPRGVFDGKIFTQDRLGEFQNYLSSQTEPNIIMELLADAQTSWVEGNLRHSILELAICTEILVKRKFFEQDSPAGAAFDYLEDKAKVQIKVLDLLDAVAEAAFFMSFRKDQFNNYKNIDHLFRCRNKIAHRGELIFRDDSGKIINVDENIVKNWWDSVMELKKWLESLDVLLAKPSTPEHNDSLLS